MRLNYYSKAGFLLPDTDNLYRPENPIIKVKDSPHYHTNDQVIKSVASFMGLSGCGIGFYRWQEDQTSVHSDRLNPSIKFKIMLIF